ncbi:MAG: DUF721 domain-containing protein [Spirochaetia bacterium]
MPEKADRVLQGLLRNINTQHSQKYVSLFRSWENIVGQDLSAHSKLEELENGVCIVGVDHPGWVQMFLMRKAAILKKLQKAYPQLEIKNIRVFVRSDIQTQEQDKTKPKATENKQEQAVQEQQNEQENPSPSQAGKKDFYQSLQRLGDLILERSMEDEEEGKNSENQ